MNSVYKYNGESLANVVAREYGTMEALMVVATTNGLAFDDAAPGTIELPDFTPEKPRPVTVVVQKELNQQITIDSGQVFTDLAVQHYGSVEKLIRLFEFNGGLVDIQAGQVITMPVLEVSDKQALAFFRGKRKVATETVPVNVGSDMAIIALGDYYIKATNNQYLKFR